MKLSRKDVFNLINEERDYQNNKWHITEQSEYAISDWLTMIKKYLNEAENATFDVDKDSAMCAIKKMSSLGIAAIEQIGCKTRKERENDFKKS